MQLPICRPKIINIELKASFGIATFKPINAATEITSIGPSIQARGILKQSATIALRIEIKITNKKSFENKSFKLLRLKGIELLFINIKNIGITYNFIIALLSYTVFNIVSIKQLNKENNEKY